VEKIIAREVSPADLNFEFYFDDDGLTSASGENCACYIPGDNRHYGFNYDEYKAIQQQAEELLDGFADLADERNKMYRVYSSYKECMTFCGVGYTSRKCHQLKEWAKNADISDTDSIAEFLTITTGKRWNSRAFCGYSQGDYCEVVYCTAHYTEDHITEIGKFWLGCGTEFCIDGCYGYYILDKVRWDEGEPLRSALAGIYGCKPEAMEVYLHSGDYKVKDYRLMEVSA
jgi:hypothetical protein